MIAVSSRNEEAGIGPVLSDRPIRILMIDDHALFCQSVAFALREEPDLIVEYCTGIKDAVALPALRSFDLVLLDNDLTMERGSDFLPAAREIGYTGFVLVVSAWLTQSEARRLLRQGVNGVFLKHENLGKLVTAIRTVSAGGQWLDCSLSELAKDPSVSPQAPAPFFTDVQRKVLRLVLEGLSNKEIGYQMQISESYVKAILQLLFQKTGVRTRGQLVRLAVEQYRDQI